MRKIKADKAFTLLELLVVIAIIGLLASVVLSSLNSARSKAEDTARIAGLKEIQKAIESYYYANDGVYPYAWYYTTAPYLGDECGHSNNWCNLEGMLSPYLSELPKDADDINQRYLYKVINTDEGVQYGLGVILDSANDASENDGGYVAEHYELGTLPRYCVNKYTGNDGNWRTWNIALPCRGGS